MRASPDLRLLAVLLAALGALGPFSIDTYLPAFPAIGAELGASPLEVQQTLTAYLLPFGLMILWHGPLSDAFGRRPVILASLVLFAAASLACAFAPGIEGLWLGRGLQGMCAGAGMVVGRAMVRDVLHDGPAAQRLMSAVAVMFALAPAVAPVIGGWIHTGFGWRAVFVFLALLTLTLAAACFVHLPETLPKGERHGMHPLRLARAYAQVFTRGEFLLLAGALALNFGAFFIYVLSAPVFLMRHLGLGPQDFAWMFVPNVTGMMLGSLASGRLAGRLSQRRTIALSYGVMLAAALLNVALNLWLPPGLAQSVTPVALYNFGMALAMPSLTLLLLDLLPRQRGLISSCQGFVQTATNALAAAVLAPLLWGSTLTLALGMAGILALGLACFGAYLLRHRRAQTMARQ
jgi:DHA1 family bicyclomycin/chloramphenicol resistance-like MFS transporter